MTSKHYSHTIRRHGRDILLPYEYLCANAGFTLTNDHIDRLVACIGNSDSISTIPEALSDHAGSMLTDSDTDQILDDIDPYTGHAATDTLMPCSEHARTLLHATQKIIAQYHSEPSHLDSVTATERDLDYFDRLIAVLHTVLEPQPAAN